MYGASEPCFMSQFFETLNYFNARPTAFYIVFIVGVTFGLK